MLARGGYVISRRKFLNDLDVGNQTGARKYSSKRSWLSSVSSVQRPASAASKASMS